MPLAEAAQRRAKRRVVIDALARIGGVAEPPVREVATGGGDLGYRNRVEFVLGLDRDGRRVAGLHGAGGAGPVDVDRCLLQPAESDRAWSGVREVLAGDAGFGAWWNRRAEPVRIVVRRSPVDGAVLVGVRSVGPLPGEARFAERLRERVPGVRGVVRIDARTGRRGGSRIRPLSGEDRIRERWLGTEFDLPAATFFQVNPGAAEVLGARVVAACGTPGGRRVVDLYGGVGAYAWALARAGDRVISVEADADAVACARSAHGAASSSAPDFVRDDVARFLADPSIGRADLVVANPPRTGFGRGVGDGIARLRPTRIVIVSCDPGTLARDVRELGRTGYRLTDVHPVDLFPQTPHVETVSVLEPA